MSIYTEIIDRLPEGHALSFDVSGEDLIIEKLTSEDLKTLLNGNNYIGIIGCIDYVALFQQYVEFTYFDPKSEANKQLTSLVWKWQTVVWVICLLPRRCVSHEGIEYDSQNLFEIVAKKFNLRLEKNVLPIALGNIELRDGSEPIFGWGTNAVKPDIPLHNLYFLTPLLKE
jgi:hypothetical protein